MKRSTLAVILLSMCSLSAFAGDRVRPSYSMPEPGGIAELATVVVGLGLYALRRRKLSN